MCIGSASAPPGLLALGLAATLAGGSVCLCVCVLSGVCCVCRVCVHALHVCLCVCVSVCLCESVCVCVCVCVYECVLIAVRIAATLAAVYFKKTIYCHFTATLILMTCDNIILQSLQQL